MTKKKRENKIQKEINASVRTGTKKREKKKNYSRDELLINRVRRQRFSFSYEQNIYNWHPNNWYNYNILEN